MADMGHKVIIVYPVPEVGWNIPNLIKDKLDDVPQFPFGRKRRAFEKMNISTSYDIYKKRTAKTFNILDSATHEHISRVYPDKIFCDEIINRCLTHDKTGLFYYDDDHLSQYGAKILVDVIGDKIVLNTRINHNQ